MLTGLDHVVIVCADLDAATLNYRALLGREPDWHARDEANGSGATWFQIGDTALELLGPSGSGAVGDKLKAMVEAGQGGLSSLAFACDNIKSTHKQFSRRDLDPSDISEGISVHSQTGKERHWKRFRLNGEKTHSVRHFILENSKKRPVKSKSYGRDCVSGIDHVVLNSSNPERASALYGSKLGGELRLDLERVDLASRFQFFRIGRATIEIVTRLNSGIDQNGPDSLWGLSWSVKDLEAAHKRVKSAGFNVTEIRPGRKKGSYVFTVLDRTCNTPTLFIERS